MKNRTTPEIEKLTQADKVAREQSRENPCFETREAARQASAALSAAIVAADLLPKPPRYSSRAGQRQAAERRAMVQDSMRRRN